MSNRNLFLTVIAVAVGCGSLGYIVGVRETNERVTDAQKVMVNTIREQGEQLQLAKQADK